LEIRSDLEIKLNLNLLPGIELEELKEGFNYTIRLAEDYLPGSTDSDEMFYTSGFVGLQSFIERAILMTTVPSHNVSSFYSLSKYPYWKQDKPPNSLANSFASVSAVIHKRKFCRKIHCTSQGMLLTM
jgi:hypothetical protein